MDSEDTRIAAEKERELYQAKAERDALRDANASLHAQVNDWHRRAVETREERDALAAKLAGIDRAEPVTIPAGWKLVPVDPTQAMCAAAVVFANGNAVYKNVAAEALQIEEAIYGEAYAAMLAAAPEAAR